MILMEPRSWSSSQGVCSKLGEQLWRPKWHGGHRARRDVVDLSFAEYLKYDGDADGSSKFWVSSESNSNAVDIAGNRNFVNPNSHTRFPGLCTNTAPYSTMQSQDTSSKWHISLDVNNQTLTG